ncbi:protein-lysine N-methyltransferase CG9154 [Eurosta solidaginis]|uniref:protein-lysine N-methyltransferase CG9154 n=1 Tax=Eurosta solidaginis TaxID=178769 RepID=UPI00353072BE
MEDNDIILPADTLKILNEFLQEKAQREKEELDRIESKAACTETMFEEDWQLSQFWYSETTKQTFGQVVGKLLAEEVKNQKSYSIALLSCPSLYGTVKKVHENVKIFEYDKRFSAYGDDFVYYDFNKANDVDYMQEYKDSFDLIIADPPFLSEECITNISKIIHNLEKQTNTKIIFCSGAIVEQWLTKCLKLKKCVFEPTHERNLGNEFVTYANFDLDKYINL